MPTRRDVLKHAGMMAALATTAPWWVVRRAHAARREKLIVWSSIALAPQVDKILKDQCYAYAKQAGIKENELQYVELGTGQIAAEDGRGAGGGEPAGCRPARQRPGVALSRPGPSPGGDRHRREDAASAGGPLSGLPRGRHA